MMTWDKYGQHIWVEENTHFVSTERAYVEVLGVELSVLGKVVVFLCHEHSLPEEILVDLLAVGLGDEPVIWSV